MSWPAWAAVTRGQKMEDNSLSEEVIRKVIASIAKTKKIDPGTVQLDSTFEELKIDSLYGLDVFFELEEAFDLTIPDDRVRSLRTVSNVVMELEKLLSEQKQVPPVR